MFNTFIKKWAILFLMLPAMAFAQVPTFISNDLDAYIKKGMEQWQVPGLALVIVKDGKVVKMQGYGIKSIATKDAVDENTLFFIASNSKLFTGTVLANLEVQGKLQLNDPVIKYLPDFALYNPANTSMVSIRDLLSHRIGTKTFQGDFSFWNTTLSRKEIMQKMQLMKPTGIFRQDYGYCNSCFMTAGEIVPKVIGISWEQYVQDSILNRLDMRNSFAASNGIETRSKNMAVPYTTSYSGKLQQVPYDQWDNLGPAASIVSNVQDLSKWLQFQLDSGRYHGKQILPWATLEKTRVINIVTSSKKSTIYPINFKGYGLGLFGADYNGRQFFWHTGGAAGMVSNVCFMPEEQLGIAILTNNDNQSFFEALRYQILDAYTNMPFKDRSAALLPAFQKEMKQQLDEIAEWRRRESGQTPPLALSAFAGDYEHPMYGKMAIVVNGNNLQISFSKHPQLTAKLTYLSKSEWLMEYNNIEYGIFSTTFSVDNGRVKSIQIPMNPFVELDTYTFQKL